MPFIIIIAISLFVDAICSTLVSILNLEIMPSNSMNVINYNRNQLRQRDKFVNRLGGYNSDKKTEYNLPKATPKQLRAIRNKLKKENQLLWLKVIGLSSIIFIALVWMLFAS